MVNSRTTNHHGSQDHGLQSPASRAAGPEAAAQLKDIKADYPGKRKPAVDVKHGLTEREDWRNLCFVFWNYMDFYLLTNCLNTAL